MLLIKKIIDTSLDYEAYYKHTNYNESNQNIHFPPTLLLLKSLNTFFSVWNINENVCYFYKIHSSTK